MEQFLGIKKAPKNDQNDLFEIENKDKPWIEKYRPQTIDKVIYQDEIVEAF